MPYLSITRLAGTGEQRILPQPVHQHSSLSLLKRAIAAAWAIQDPNKFALDLTGGAFGDAGAVLLTKEEEWSYLRVQIEHATKPIILTLRTPPTQPTLGDLQPRTGAAKDKRVVELEIELAVAQAEVQGLREELARLRTASVAKIVESIQSNTRSSSDRVISKVTNMHRELAANIDETRASAQRLHVNQDRTLNRIFLENMEQLEALKLTTAAFQAQAKEMAALKIAVADVAKAPLTQPTANGSQQPAPPQSSSSRPTPSRAANPFRAASSGFADVD